MAGIFYSTLKGLKNQIFSRPKFLRGSSTVAPRLPRRTSQFELSQVNCKSFLAFVNPSSPVLGDAGFNPDSFTVHGFRPIPKCVQNTTFQLNDVDPKLMKMLTPVWRALNNPYPDSYWQYQAVSQGAYQDIFPFPHQYFLAVVCLYHRFNFLLLLRAVEEGDKKPSCYLFFRGFWWHGIKCSRMMAGLTSLIGAEPRLWLWEDSGFYFLREGEIVVDAQLKPISVPPWDRKHALLQKVHPNALIWF